MLGYISDLCHLSIMDEVGKFVDRNLQTIRWIVIGAGVTGVAVILRSIRLGTKFRVVQTIPQQFFAAEMSLYGRVRSVDSKGILSVDHIPVIDMSAKPKTNRSEDPNLKVVLAAVKHTAGSISWLQKNVVDKPVFFKLLAGQNTDLIYANVNYRKLPLIFRSVNLHLIRTGLATTATTPLVDATQGYQRLLQLAAQAEKKAAAGSFFSIKRILHSTQKSA